MPQRAKSGDDAAATESRRHQHHHHRKPRPEPSEHETAHPPEYNDVLADAPWWVHTDLEGNYEEREHVDAATLEREPPSLLRRGLMLGLVYFTLLVVCGPFTGPQATFGALARRGVYSASCDAPKALPGNDDHSHGTNHTPTAVATADGECAQQAQSIESAADLAMSISTFTMLFWGLAKDVVGARRIALFAISLWTVTTGLSGFRAPEGTLWLVLQSIAASAAFGSYSALGLVHLKQACASERLYGVAGFLASATWDAAVLLNFGLVKLFEWQELTLWQAYAVYAAVAGIPVCIGLANWPKTPDEEAADAEEAAILSAAGSRTGTPAIASEGAFPVTRSARSLRSSTPTPPPPVSVSIPVMSGEAGSKPPKAPGSVGSRRASSASADDLGRSSSAPRVLNSTFTFASAKEPSSGSGCDASPAAPAAPTAQTQTTPPPASGQREKPPLPRSRSVSVTPEPPQFQADAYNAWAARRSTSPSFANRGTRTSLVSLGSATTVTSNTRAGRAIARTMKDARAIMRKSSYWLFVAHLTAIVTLGCFVIANVGSVALAHGYADTERAQAVSTYMMAGLGVTCVAPGRLIQRLGVQRGIAAVMVALIALLLGVAGVGAFGGRGAAALYGNLALLFMWRVWGYGLGFSYMSWRFGAHPHGIGFCYGVVYGVAGLVSMGAGEVAGAALHRDPEGMLRPVMLALGGAALVVEVAFLVHVVRVRTDGGEVREAERARLERVGLLSRVNAEWASSSSSSDDGDETHEASSDSDPKNAADERAPLIRSCA